MYSLSTNSAKNKIIDGLKIANNAILKLNLPCSKTTEEFVLGVLKDGNFIDSIIDGPDEELQYVEVGGRKFSIHNSGTQKPEYKCRYYTLLQSKIHMLKCLEREIREICGDEKLSVVIDIFDTEITYNGSK